MIKVNMVNACTRMSCLCWSIIGSVVVFLMVLMMNADNVRLASAGV
jgi:hypothetical protein